MKGAPLSLKVLPVSRARATHSAPSLVAPAVGNVDEAYGSVMGPLSSCHRPSIGRARFQPSVDVNQTLAPSGPPASSVRSLRISPVATASHASAVASNPISSGGLALLRAKAARSPSLVL